MFKTIKTAHKIAMIGAKWTAATGIDPGDGGKLVATKAGQYVENLGLEPEDAWLTAMVNYIDGMPHLHKKRLLAAYMLRFLDQYEGKIPLSAMTIIGARSQAESILDKADALSDSARQPDPPYQSTSAAAPNAQTPSRPALRVSLSEVKSQEIQAHLSDPPRHTPNALKPAPFPAVCPSCSCDLIRLRSSDMCCPLCGVKWSAPLG